MREELKERGLNVGIFVLTALLFVALTRARLVHDLFQIYLGNQAFNVSIVLQLASLAAASGLLIINLYSFSLFREMRQLLFSFIFLVLLTILAMNLMMSVNENLPLTLLEKPQLQGGILFLLLIAMTLLFVKLLIMRKRVPVSMPMRRVPFIFLGLSILVLAGFMWLSKESAVLADIEEALLYILLFSNFIGYSLFYLIEGTAITGGILFALIIGISTYFFTPGNFFTTDYQGILGILFRGIALVVLLNAFYRELFSSYLLEVEDLNTQRDLYTENLKEVVEERTRELQKANDQLEREIDAAKRLQQSLLPVKDIVYSNASFISRNMPCDRLSGDFFDIYTIDEDRVGMYILDVSGHGINAALMNIYIYHYIRSSSPLIKRLIGDKPHENLRYLYDEFNKMNFPDHMHVVIFIAAYDMKNGVLTYASGGLNAQPIVLRHTGDLEVLDQSSGFPICKMADFFTPEYFSAQIQLYKGDRIFFYTDGLLDERQGIDLTEEDLKILLLETMDEPLVVLDRALNKRLEPIGDSLVDDISYFMMEAT